MMRIGEIQPPQKRLPVQTLENKLAAVMNAIGKTAGRSAIFVLAGILVLFACGCSSFRYAWRKAESAPIAPGSMEGRWEGRWLSETNGHQGKLLCIVSRQEDGDYAARFRATYMKILRFSYTVPLEVDHTNGVWHFHGEENLGKLAGGVYQYEGTASLTNFHSTYRSKYDHGVFEMERPPDPPAPRPRSPAH